MLVIQTFRADRLLAMSAVFVASVFGEVFQQSAEQELDLGEVVATEVGYWPIRVWSQSDGDVGDGMN
jgi:hypothetical protein